ATCSRVSPSRGALTGIVTAILGLGLLAGPAAASGPAAPRERAPAAGETARLHALFDREWEMRLRDNPLFATSVGRHDYDALLPSAALPDLERQHRERRQMLAELAAIDRSRLAAADAVDAAIWHDQLRDRIDEF